MSYITKSVFMIMSDLVMLDTVRVFTQTVHLCAMHTHTCIHVLAQLFSLDNVYQADDNYM